MRKLISALAAASLGFTAAPMAMAQSNSMAASARTNDIVSDPGKLFYDYDVENVIPVLQEIGFKWEGRTAPDGTKIIKASAPNGLIFFLRPTSCRKGANSGCAGINMVAAFQGDVDQRTVNSFNYRYAFSSAGVDEGGAAYISRYEIADYGVPKGNFALSMLVFLDQATFFSDTLATATKTVSTDSFAGDLAANSLNMQAILADQKMAKNATSAIQAHQISLEETTKFVSVLMEADKLTPGKIVNFTKKPE